MTYLRDELSGTARIDAAVALVVRLRAGSPGVPLDRLAAQAVDTVFCTRVTFASDAVECRLAHREPELTAEITRRALLATEGNAALMLGAAEPPPTPETGA